MKNNTIKIKNELPELLEAVCDHKDCPEWLKDGIWELFSNQTQSVVYSASWWRCQFEAIDDYETLPRESELPPNVIRFTGLTQ
jgi:hypothetical protein